MDTFFDAAKSVLDRAKAKYGTAKALADASGVDPANISRWTRGKRIPKLEDIATIFDVMQAKIVLPDEEDPARDICFVDARAVPAGANQPPPEVEDYLAVPLVEEVGAGPGLIPQGELLSWFLVYRHQDAIRYRRDLIAVRIGKRSTSMLPILHPGDVVPVDRQDRDVMTPGRIMLVMDPDGAGMIKRVAVEEVKSERDWRIVFYSDNVANHPPIVYSLREDFLGDWDRAVVGRAIRAWSDISGM